VTAKDELRSGVEQLSEAEAALWLAAWRGDQLAWKLLHAPIDDEPETDGEREAAARGRRALAEGRSRASSVGEPLRSLPGDEGLLY
jgi:hypothetical protein